MLPEHLREIWAHMEWADSAIWKALARTGGANEDGLLLDTLVHLHVVQHAFLALWQNDVPQLRQRQDFGTLQEVVTWARAFYTRAAAFFATLDPSRIDEVVAIPWLGSFEQTFGRPARPVTLAQTAYQVVAHSMHHRGQANRRLREIGGEPPLVDYIAWLWLGRPDPEWPDRTETPMETPMVRCDSCGMPVDVGPYCEHCVDETGALQSFEVRLAKMTDFILSSKPELDRAVAADQARAHMRTQPAWRDRPELAL